MQGLRYGKWWWWRAGIWIPGPQRPQPACLVSPKSLCSRARSFQGQTLVWPGTDLSIYFHGPQKPLCPGRTTPDIIPSLGLPLGLKFCHDSHPSELRDRGSKNAYGSIGRRCWDVSDQSTSEVPLNKHFTACSLALWFPGGSTQSWQGILDIWPTGGPRSTAFTLALHASFIMTRKRCLKILFLPLNLFPATWSKDGSPEFSLELGVEWGWGMSSGSDGQEQAEFPRSFVLF